jgi:hypothetical protein
MKNLFKVLLTLFLLSPFLVLSQVPVAPSNGLWGIIASQYQVGTTAQGSTTAKITLQNTTLTKFAGVQFRLFYDKIAFTNASVSLIGSTTNLDLQSITNTSNGFITITLSYTGPSAAYTIPNGEIFLITFTHAPASTFNNLTTISNLTWTGLETFTPYAAKQDGMDTTLSVHNYGGVFTPVNFDYHGVFRNVTGTGAKNLTLALEKKPLGGTTWTQHSVYTTDLNGNFNISVPLDTSFWDVRLAIQGDTMGVGNVVSTTDAQLINQWVLGNGTMTGFDYYTADVNGSNNITISDVWGVFGRISGRFSSWVNNTKDIEFFTASEYATINGSSTNYTSSIAGVTNFTFEILPGQPDSVVFYVMVPGDANGTGYNMARTTPIEILVGPNPDLEDQIYNVIDTQVEYDFPTQTIEVNVPNITVQSGNLVDIPVTLITNGVGISSLQFGLRYDEMLLKFKGIISSSESMKWITYVNPNNNQIDWGGFDPTNTNTLKDGDKVITLQFLALQPQNMWDASPLYTTNKFAGSEVSNDLTITPTNGVLQVLKIVGGVILDDTNMEVYPNPYMDEVTITFKVEETTNATLSVYDLLGRRLVTIVEGNIPNGQYSYNENLGELVSGVYIVKLSVENGVPLFKRIVKQ